MATAGEEPIPPAPQVEPGAKPKRPRARRLPSLGRALIVEDDAILAMMIADALREAGADHVSVCPSVASAMVELDRLKPEVLVLDVHLADRDDGWSMAELVIELSPSRPTIIFSTGAPESIPPHIAELGTVLTKPFLPAALIEIVRAQRRPGLFTRLRAAISSAAD